jgi:RNA ligase
MSAAIANADPNAVCNILTDKDNKRVDLHVVASWLDNVPDGWTLMFELTSPQNRIIVKYSDTKLWFHGARDAEGIEHSPEEVIAMFGMPFDIPKRLDLNKREDIIDALSKMNGLENEGFVVVDEENWTRVKMKSPSYLNMKFVRDNDNPEGIWRLVITEQYDDILPNAPELKEKIEAQVKQLVEFNKKLDAEIAYAIDVWDNDSKHNRKHFAEFVNNQVKPNLRKIYFSAIDGKPVAKEIKEKMINLKKGYTDIYLPIMNDLGVKAKVEW